MVLALCTVASRDSPAVDVQQKVIPAIAEVPMVPKTPASGSDISMPMVSDVAGG
jgi:hypothetical protein